MLFLLALAAIGVWSSRRTRNPRDFFIAGQRLGLVVTALATMSAAFSGFVFLGGPGLAYRLGIASLWIVLPVGITSGLLCWVLGRRLRYLAAVREIYSIPDALAARFQNRGVAGAAAVAVVTGTLGYLAAQLRALGLVIETVFGGGALPGDGLAASMLVGALVLVAYSVAGGVVAGVYTDLVQGGLMLAAAVGVFVYALDAGGGLAGMSRTLAAADGFGEDFLLPFGTVPMATAMGFFFVFGIGVLGQPHMVHKLFMVRQTRHLRYFPLVLGGGQLLCLLLWLGIGLAVPALVARGELAPLVRADDAAPAFLAGSVPAWLGALVAVGVLSAIMSTCDAFANVGAAALVRDLPRSFGRPLADELAWGRGATAALILVAAVLGFAYDDLVALLGTFAFGTFAAALAPALAVGMTWQGTTPAGALASIVTGIVTNVGLELAPRLGLDLSLADGVQPTAVALASSFLVLLGVSACTAPVRLPDDVTAALEERRP